MTRDVFFLFSRFVQITLYVFFLCCANNMAECLKTYTKSIRRKANTLSLPFSLSAIFHCYRIKHRWHPNVHVFCVCRRAYSMYYNSYTLTQSHSNCAPSASFPRLCHGAFSMPKYDKLSRDSVWLNKRHDCAVCVTTAIKSTLLVHMRHKCFRSRSRFFFFVLM